MEYPDFQLYTEPCVRRWSFDSPGRARTMGVGQATHLQLTHRLVRIAARTVMTSGVSHRYCVRIEDLRWRWLLILLLSARQFRRHKSRLGCRLNAGGVEWAERHGCRESRPPPWMADGGGPTERRRSEGTRGTRAQPGARTLGYLVSFQVTRQRRNRSGVSQSPISRAAITWSIQISSCTRNPV